MINKKQCTIIWWVNNLNIRHKEPMVLGNILRCLKEKYEYEEIGVMKPVCKKDHDFRGIKLNYEMHGNVKIDIKQQTRCMLTGFEKNEDPKYFFYHFRWRLICSTFMVVREIFVTKVSFLRTCFENMGLGD